MRTSDWSSDVCSSDLYGLERHLAIPNVQTPRKMHVAAQSLFPAQPGDAQRVRQGDVVERIGAGARNRARHVGARIMDDAVDDVGWIGVAGRMARLEAAAQVHRTIDEHRAGAHDRKSGEEGKS